MLARLFVFAVALAALVVALPARAGAEGGLRSDGLWPLPRADEQGRAAVVLPLPDAARPRAWTFRAGSHVWGYQPGMTVWSSPSVVAVAGRALVLAGSYDRNVYAVDALSGRKVWRLTTGGGVYGTPVVARGPDGKPVVYVASSDRLVYALDAEIGRRLWVHAVKTWRPTMGGARLSAPCVGRAGGEPAVFVGHWVWDKSISGHLQAGGVTALHAHTGKVLWSAELGDTPVGAPLCTELDGASRVFVGAESGNVFALDGADGRELWSFTDRDAVKGTPALHRSPVDVRVVFGSKYGRVRALCARTGAAVWRFGTGHWVDSSPAVAAAGGRDLVMVGSYDTFLYALDALSGQEVWRYRAAAGVYAGPAVVPHAGTHKVLVGAWDHHLHCVDAADGALLWSAYTGRPLWDSVTLGDSTWSSPAVAVIGGEPVVFVGSYGGPLHALPVAQAEKRAAARQSSNLDFWLTLPLVLLAVTGAAIGLTRRARRSARRNADAGQA